jgi:hypothetical protein
MIKNILLASQILVMTAVFGQDTTIVWVNNKKVTQNVSTNNQKGRDLLLKKSLYRNYQSLVIQVTGGFIYDSPYKKSLEINGSSIFIADETKNKPGFFDLSGTKARTILAGGKKLKLYLVLDPANPRMLMPSRRIYLGDLLMK